MDLLMPQLGQTMTEGTVTIWHKKVGEPIKADELLFEISTDKVEMEIPAPANGVLTEILVGEGETVAVGTRLGVLADPGSAAQAPVVASVAEAPPPPPVAPPRAKPAGVGRRDAQGKPLSPVVRRLIAEHGLDPAAIKGTGANGRIARRDVLAVIGEQPTPRPAAIGPASEIVPLSRIRRQIGEHMVRSTATSPHVLQAVEVDFHAVEGARQTMREAWRSREGFGLSYLPFVAQAVAAAIAEFPHVNASIDGDNLVLHRRVNLGIAVDLGFEGLIVPVLKDIQVRTLADIARGINDLATRAREKRLSPDDLSEGTYTLSNSGPYGTLITAPIINQPQVAILSTDGVRKRPVVIEAADGDAIAIRPVGVLSQCFDHRAFDGAYSAAFLHRVGEVLETRDWSAALTQA